MADVPDGIVLKRHRDLEGMRKTLWPRRVLVGATVAFALLGLANVFGQRPVTASADTAQASLKLNAPDHLRGGLLFSARFTSPPTETGRMPSSCSTRDGR